MRVRLRGLRAAVTVGCLAAVCLGTRSTQADTLTTKDGRVFEGTVISQTAEGVTFEVHSGGIRGRVFFAADRIEKIELGLTEADRLKEAYEARKQALDLDTPAGWHQLGLWCAERKMYDQAAQAFTEALTRDRANYLITSSLAYAEMELARGRPLSARGLLEQALKDRPDDPELKAKRDAVQEHINAEVRSVFDLGQRAYARRDYPTALALLRRVALEADPLLLAALGRDLAASGEPSLAEMLVNCRLADEMVDRPTIFQEVTPLEKPLLLARLAALVEAGVKSAEAARNALAAKQADQLRDRLTEAPREFAGLDRLDRLAAVAEGLGGELKDPKAEAAMRAARQALQEAYGRITLLYVEALQVGALQALKAVQDDAQPVSERVKAGEAAALKLREGQKTLGALAAGAPAGDLAGEVARRRRELDALERDLAQARDHLKRVDTALDRALAAYDKRDHDGAVLWFSRLLGEATDRERSALAGTVRRRTGRDLADVMVDLRLHKARKDGRFERVTDFERDALDRELISRASQTMVRAYDALRDARAAAPGSDEQRAQARRAIALADEAIFYLEGRRQIGLDLSRRERDRIDADLAAMQRVARDASRLT